MTKLLIIWLVIVWFSAVQGIYNGQIANKHQFPYLVYIRSSQFYCAGSLISDRHVLTAAHCLMRSSSILIILGIHENYGWGYSDGVNAISTKFWIHENFSLPLAQNDIGIVELPKSVYKYVNNTRKVKSIGISPTTDIDLNESEVITAGWGHTAQYTIANRPYYTKMSLIYTTECIKYQGHYIEAITKDHICTMKITGMPCDGDSGAPIVSLKTNKVVGVLSYVKDAENGIYMHYNDCKSKVPAVSTRISSYIDWISAKTGIDFSKTEKVCNINRLVNATNIDQFEGCEIIEGRIEINNESFSEMEPEKLEVFSSVKVLRGDLKVSGNHENFKDLSFLRNLEGINGAVFIENVSFVILTFSLIKKIPFPDIP